MKEKDVLPETAVNVPASLTLDVLVCERKKKKKMKKAHINSYIQ